ncbi:hypothetical protein E5288_WYG016156 [Bos mutus]|uniref:Galectin n=1 Tax=Bos mutus TaxID=72004 RepID=A0A6B0RLM5_9CETA|nr:hypothetical protein [Bos mutus]
MRRLLGIPGGKVTPFVTTIFGGLRAGKMVMLQGAVPLNAHRWTSSAAAACTPGQISPSTSTLASTPPNPTSSATPCTVGAGKLRPGGPHVALQRGASFLILFLFGNEEMKVSVNGQHFLHYRYRLPLSRVDTLGIFGDISVTAVGFLNINPFVEGGSEYPVGHSSPVFLQEVPCFHALPRGLWPGQVIIVRGLVLPEPKDFMLSLRDEAAHVPVTLRASFADRTLAWVSRWGRKKLILAPFLFYPQRFFEVLLLCQEGGLKLALNGQGVGATSLGQQVLEQLRELRISGSVQLYCVHY